MVPSIRIGGAGLAPGRQGSAEQDVRNELFALLASARKTYLRDVIDCGKFSLQEHSHWMIAWN